MPEGKYTDFNTWKAKKGAEQEEHRRKREATFAETLKGNFDLIPKGCSFTSTRPGIRDIAIFHPEKSRSLNVVVVPKENPNRRLSFSLNADGVLKRQEKEKPGDITINETELLQEIIDNFARLDVTFFRPIHGVILPEGEGAAGGATRSPETKKKAQREETVDTQRIERLRQKALFGGFDTKGLRNYYVFVFPSVMVLENPNIDNAAYFIDIPENIPVPKKNSPNEEKDAFFEHPQIKALLAKSKQEHIHEKTARIFHSGDWEKRMDELLATKEKKAQ